MVEANHCNLTEDEADLYDRQIRLWGLDSQKRLRAATILLIGLKGLGAEFCKNIVLAGIKAITLMDDKKATEDEKFSQFLIPREKLGSNRAAASLERAQRLNPMVEIKVDESSVDDKPDQFFTQFHVVVATDCNLDQLLRINNICHNSNVKFFCADVFGFYGYMFADLQTQELVDEVTVCKAISKDTGNKKLKLNESQMVKFTRKITLTYPTLEESLVVDTEIRSKRKMENMVSFYLMKILLKFRVDFGRNPQAATRAEDLEKLKEISKSEIPKFGVAESDNPITDKYLSNLFSQVSPICAILGGEMAQEVIKTVSQKGETHQNFFFFNPVKNHGIVIKNGQCTYKKN